MGKMSLLLIALLMIVGCAITNTSRTASFNLNKKGYTTYVKANDGPFGTIIYLYVNDQRIAAYSADFAM